MSVPRAQLARHLTGCVREPNVDRVAVLCAGWAVPDGMTRRIAAALVFKIPTSGELLAQALA